MVVASILLASGCIELSPFESDLDEDECDQNARNLERLAALSPASGRLRFAVLGDSHQALEELSDIVDAVNAQDVAFVLHLGDMTHVGLRQEYRWTLDELKRLRRPFLTAIGNHDALSNGKDVYGRMFGAYDYQFTYGDVRFVILNTNQREFGGDVPDLAWLSDTTALPSESSVTIVAAHQRPADPAYDQILADNQVDAMISAHVHHFEMDLRAGVPAFVVGTVQDREWALATIEDGSITFEDCVSSTCSRRHP
jgi:predicted phosphodiesterase